MLRIDLIPHSDCQTERQPFFSLHVQRLALRGPFGERIFTQAGGEHLVSRVEQFHALGQRDDDVHARIQRSCQRALGLADADSRRPAGHKNDGRRDQQGRPRHHGERDGGSPAHDGWRRRRRCRITQWIETVRQQQVKIVGKNSSGDHEHQDPRAHKQIFQEEHSGTPLSLLARVWILPRGGQIPR